MASLSDSEQALCSPNLGFRRFVGFGIGDFGINIFWATTNLFVLFFYTDVIGLPNQAAGYVIMGAMLWDAVTDPLIGYLASRTKTRWGRYRPYIFWGAIPLGVSFALVFYKPDLAVGALILYALFTQILFRTFYTIVGVPYSSLSARITQNPDSRGGLAVFRILFAAAASVLVAALTLDTARTLGEGDLAAGFGLVAIAFAILGVVALLICFLSTREHIDDQRSEPSPGFRDILKMLKANTVFWIAFAIVLFGTTGATLSGKSTIYYLKYNLNAEALIGPVTAAIALVVFICVPMWGLLSRKIGKRQVWVSGLTISVFTGFVLFLNPVETPVVFTPIVTIGAVGSAASYFSVWATIPDTVEYGEWKSGVRAESVLFGAVSFAQKLALGLATGVAGLLLDVTGYEANTAQTAETLFGLKVLMSIVPAGFAAVCLIFAFNYRLDQDRHAHIREEISRRNSTQ